MESAQTHQGNNTDNSSSQNVSFDPFDFKCPVCYESTVMPTTLVCGHTVCRPCLARCVMQTNKRQCPKCWRGFTECPSINHIVVGMINEIYGGQLRQISETESSLLMQLEAQPSQRVPDSEVLELQQRFKETARAHGVNLVNDIWFMLFKSLFVLVFVIISANMVYGSLYSQRALDESVAIKPVDSWTVGEVSHWLIHLGSWTQSVSKYTIERNIDGSKLLALDMAHIGRYIHPDNKNKFVIALADIKQSNSSVLTDFWQFKEKNLRTTLFLEAGFCYVPRLTLLSLFLYEHKDVYLPLIHMPNISMALYQMLVFVVEWLCCPYLLFAQFILLVMNRNWVIGILKFAQCLSLMIRYIKELYIFYQEGKDAVKSIGWCSTMNELLKVFIFGVLNQWSWLFAFIMVASNITPTFLCNLWLYWRLYCVPIWEIASHVGLSPFLWKLFQRKIYDINNYARSVFHF